MQLLVQIGQLMLSLMILVMLHEFGHYMTARWFKVRVERFFCFFDVKFAIWKKKIGDTVYGIGWLPLGGYVKLSGMIDESLDTEQMKKEPQPWEFRSKPAWQRLIIMLGGVIVNFALAIVIYTVLLMNNGENYLDVTKMKYGLAVDSIQSKMGLMEGDIPLGVDGVKYDALNDIGREALIGGESLIIKRNNQEIILPITNETRSAMLSMKGDYFEPLFTFSVDSVVVGMAAEKAGMKKGDMISAINGNPISFYQDLVVALEEYKGQKIPVTVTRKGEEVDLTAEISPEGKIGISPSTEYLNSLLSTKDYSFAPALVGGVSKSVQGVTAQVKGIKMLFGIKDGRKQVAGPIGMVKQMPQRWNWTFFWSFTAMLSAWLAFLNILPIPALDGGHAVFALYEMFTGRKPDDKVLEKAQIVGVFILLGLMVLIFGNDIVNAVFG